MRHQLFIVWCDNEQQNAVLKATSSKEALSKAKQKYPKASKIEVRSMGYFYE